MDGCPLAAGDAGVGTSIQTSLLHSPNPNASPPSPPKKIYLKKQQVGIISQNPEKSKHLETATMRVGAFWIDFVNLRTEAYTDGSRIPSMDIGGPEVCVYVVMSIVLFNNSTRRAELVHIHPTLKHTTNQYHPKTNQQEDALRRDLTINSLFYNVNTGEVEDFSGRGLADMRDGECV